MSVAEDLLTQCRRTGVTPMFSEWLEFINPLGFREIVKDLPAGCGFSMFSVHFRYGADRVPYEIVYEVNRNHALLHKEVIENIKEQQMLALLTCLSGLADYP